MLKNYFKSAWKAIWKSKQVSIINITGLSVGITAAVFILLWVQNEVSYDNYHPGAENIYRITNTLEVSKNEKWVWETSPLLLAGAAQKDIPEIEQTAMLSPAVWNPIAFTVNNEIFTEKQGAYVSQGWFTLFHYDFTQGSPEAFFKNPYSIILSETKAKKYFGNNPAVGKVMHIDSVNYTVQAVVKDAPAATSFQYDVLLPVDAMLADSNARKNSEDWGNFNFITFLKLHPGANAASVGKKITGIFLRDKKDSSIAAGLQPIKSMHFETDVQNSSFLHTDKKIVYIFSVFALLLLVTACINYINLTTATASLRVKEISIRKITGAKRRQLFAQFVTECLIVCLLSLCVTLVLIKTLLPFFNQLTEKEFALPLTSSTLWNVLGGTLLFAIVVNSIYPAALLSSFSPMNIFRGKNVLKVKDATLRKGLVVFQFTLSVILIVCSIVIFKQLHFIQNTNPGYSRSQVISLQVPYNTHTKMAADFKKNLNQTMSQMLQNKSSIASVALANQPIIDVQSSTSGSSDWDGRAKDFNPTLVQLAVDDNFQKVFNLALKEGRWFDEKNITDKHNVILNETAIQQLGIHKPFIGQRFVFHRDTGKIIAVVKDFHFRSMHDKIAPLVIFNNSRWLSYIFIKTAPGNTSAAIKDAEAVWKQLLPNDAFNYTFLDESFNNLYKADLKVSSLILLLAVIVIVISAMGLFALAAFTTQQRVKEIGIRKVLGASVSNITMLLSKDFVKLVLLSIIIASPIAWWAMSKWLQDFAYRINISWWMFFAAGVAALFIALATISFQAIKSALTNPVDSLRME
jgi:putative ABC transport system permease protein